MNTDLQEKLAGLPTVGEVFIGRVSNLQNENWKVYQDNELAYWRKKYASGYYPDYKESFHRFLSRFGVDADSFSAGKLMEIGCGPQGFSASLVQLAEKQPATHVIIDSLLDKYQDFEAFSLFGKDTIKIASMGENVPVPSDFFDIVICQNVLDHVDEPSAVINEIHRTLRKRGVALISVHILSPVFCVFKAPLKRLDKNHPHHFTHKQVLSLFNGFEIKYNFLVPLYQDNPNLSKNIKTLFATRFLSTVYLKMQKK